MNCVVKRLPRRGLVNPSTRLKLNLRHELRCHHRRCRQQDNRASASAAARPGGVIMHIGLQDNDGGLDVRRLTLQEITFIGTYTYTPLDLRATMMLLHNGSLGDLGWLEQRSLDDGAGAFDDLLHGRSAAPKIVLRP